MHKPDTSPHPSLYFDYKIYPFSAPAELKNAASRHKVVIIGGGPIGLSFALDLARFGVPSVIIEQDNQICLGSRAIVLVRRSMEILQQLGVHQAFVDKGLGWSSGRSFYGGQEVYRMVMPESPNSRFEPGTNIQQQYIEQFLVDEIEKNPLIDLRWATKLVALKQNEDFVEMALDTPEGEYTLQAEWLVAADGGRSAVRRELGLKMEGNAYAGNFVIADIKADIDRPTERLCFFDPHWSPGNNVLVHRQPDGMWRLDYKLPEEEEPAEALENDLLSLRINSILEMLGAKVDWKLDWATVYSASALTLTDYRKDRCFLIGDAAHLLPIFGVRGANTGFQDANNLAWKLAAVANGWGGQKLLKSYSEERVGAVWEICTEAGRSTRFMAPPSRGYRVMRDAVLSLTLEHDFPKDLLHWRTARPHAYDTSSLNTRYDGKGGGEPCIRIGDVALDVALSENDFLFDHLQNGFNILCFTRSAPTAELVTRWAKGGRHKDVPVNIIALTNGRKVAGVDCQFDVAGSDFETLYGNIDGMVYVLRPDQHICAWFSALDAKQITGAIETACGKRG